jgi:exopolysaccharide biosynthesis polyprenyl glycosylphosphotransferase
LALVAITELRRIDTDLAARAPSRTVSSLRRILTAVALLDLATLGVAAGVATEARVTFDIWAAEPTLGLIRASVPWILLTWVCVLGSQGAYSRRHFGVGPDEFRAITLASVIAAGLVGMFCYLTQLPLSRGFVLATFLFGWPLLLLERYVVRKALHRARRHGRLLHRVIAVGGASGVGEVVAVLDRERYVGYQVVGAATPFGGVNAEAMPVPVLGDSTDILDLCREHGADTVLVSRGGYSSSTDLRRIAWRLEGSEIDLVVVPSLTDVAGPRISMRPVAGLPLLHVEEPQAGEAGGITKRIFDVVVSGALLLLLAPLLAVLALIVRLHDGGPVLFRQARVGRDGRIFHMLKFRSMVVDAEERKAALAAHNEGAGVLFKMREDPRITPIGRVLRRYSLDELPQLLNVLKGDMSLVGPRPPLQDEVDRYHDDTRRRLLVRPGITGLWQVSGRSELSWDESVRLDLYYVDNWSMLSDLVIMAKTVRAVVGSSGAY